MGAEVWDRIVLRTPMESVGKSGSHLEHGLLDDDRRVVIKRVVADDDWIMQATNDAGRVADLWEDGVFERAEAILEHATLDVRRLPSGAEVLMEDVSAHLFSDAAQLRAGHERVLVTAQAIHDEFASPGRTGLCDLGDYYSFLSPQTCSRFSAGHEVPRLALDGWTRFHELVPEDVARAIDAIHRDPRPLVRSLLQHDITLVHGDLKMANLGMVDNRVVVLDWGTLTTWAPPAVDYAWYMAINSGALESDHDMLLEQCRRVIRPIDDEVLDLALVGAFAQLGWEKALGATSTDGATRERESLGLSWWVERSHDALSKWSL